MRRLLTIEDAFQLKRRGVIVAPALSAERAVAGRDPGAELRRPDGTVSSVELEIIVEHAQVRTESAEGAARKWRRVCLLKGISIVDARVGTEVWCRDDLVLGHEAG